MKKKVVKSIGIGLVTLVVLAFVLMKVSGKSPIAFGMHNAIAETEALAIGGYDAVAYHTDNIALKGESKLSTEYQGSTWLFSSEANRDLFKASPEAYVPAFGGHCAYACSKGVAAAGSPLSFSNIEGKVYLFAEDAFKEKFSAEGAETKQAANANWK